MDGSRAQLFVADPPRGYSKTGLPLDFDTLLCKLHTLCYAILVPGRKSGLRARIWPDANRAPFEIGTLAGLGRPDC